VVPQGAQSGRQVGSSVVETYSCRAVIVGGGVVGLATGYHLSALLDDVWLLESAARPGTGISSRNSEVIHAGIYYPQGSLKATSCVRGRALLYEYCERFNVPFRRCGKLIVASEEAQVETLDSIYRHGIDNGVAELQWLGSAEVHALEPQVKAVAALLSPATGIIDSHQYMQSLQAGMQAQGAQIVLGTAVEGIDPVNGRHRLRLSGAQPSYLETPLIINCAGLQATELLNRCAAYPPHMRRLTYHAKGSYFSYSGRVPFVRLVYPVPEPGGLGVHLTLDMAGQAKFGPDVEWVDQLDFRVDPAKRAGFASAIKRFWPGVDSSRLQPSYAGIRPKLHPAGEPAADFLIEGPEEHTVAGLFSFLGVESPGLTASLALAELLCEKLREQGCL
jgi:L-2-hydroxyglutarate oxidase LhgO